MCGPRVHQETVVARAWSVTENALTQSCHVRYEAVGVIRLGELADGSAAHPRGDELHRLFWRPAWHVLKSELKSVLARAPYI